MRCSQNTPGRPAVIVGFRRVLCCKHNELSPGALKRRTLMDGGVEITQLDEEAIL